MNSGDEHFVFDFSPAIQIFNCNTSLGGEFDLFSTWYRPRMLEELGTWDVTPTKISYYFST